MIRLGVSINSNQNEQLRAAFDSRPLGAAHYLKSKLGLNIGRQSNGSPIAQSLEQFSQRVSPTTGNIRNQLSSTLEPLYNIAVGVSSSGYQLECADQETFSQIVEASDALIAMCGHEVQYSQSRNLAESIKAAAERYLTLFNDSSSQATDSGGVDAPRNEACAIAKNSLEGMRHTLIADGKGNLFEMTNSLSDVEYQRYLHKTGQDQRPDASNKTKIKRLSVVNQRMHTPKWDNGEVGHIRVAREVKSDRYMFVNKQHAQLNRLSGEEAPAERVRFKNSANESVNPTSIVEYSPASKSGDSPSIYSFLESSRTLPTIAKRAHEARFSLDSQRECRVSDTLKLRPAMGSRLLRTGDDKYTVKDLISISDTLANQFEQEYDNLMDKFISSVNDIDADKGESLRQFVVDNREVLVSTYQVLQDAYHEASGWALGKAMMGRGELKSLLAHNFVRRVESVIVENKLLRPFALCSSLRGAVMMLAKSDDMLEEFLLSNISDRGVTERYDHDIRQLINQVDVAEDSLDRGFIAMIQVACWNDGII